MPLFGLGKKKEVATEEKPASIDDAMLHNTKGVSAEEAFKRSPPMPQETPTPVQKEPMNDDDDLFADFPMFGETEKNEPKKVQSQAQAPPPTPPPTPQQEPQPLQEQHKSPTLEEPQQQSPPPTFQENSFPQEHNPVQTEQFTQSLNEEVPDLMDVPQNTSVDVKIRGDINSNEIPEPEAPVQNYDVENVEFGTPNEEEPLLNYIVKGKRGREDLFIELNDMRKLTEDIDNLSTIQNKSDEGFAQVNEIHEHERKLLMDLRKSLEDMHRQFSLIDALIFENNENK